MSHALHICLLACCQTRSICNPLTTCLKNYRIALLSSARQMLGAPDLVTMSRSPHDRVRQCRSGQCLFLSCTAYLPASLLSGLKHVQVIGCSLCPAQQCMAEVAPG